jgi:hypothetical protein
VQAGILAYKDVMDNIWTWLAGLAAVAAAAGTIYFQHNQITSLKQTNVLLNEKTVELEAKIALGVKERIRLNASLQELAQKKAEVEVRYITKPVTVFRDIIKTETPEVVEATAEKEVNEVFTNISTNATNYSLRVE